MPAPPPLLPHREGTSQHGHGSFHIQEVLCPSVIYLGIDLTFLHVVAAMGTTRFKISKIRLIIFYSHLSLLPYSLSLALAMISECSYSAPSLFHIKQETYF